MNKILITIFVGLMMMSTSFAGTYDSELDLFEKDSSWDVVVGGGEGTLKYNSSKPEFEFDFSANGISTDNYTLINYPDPWPGDGLVCLDSGDSDGSLSLSGSYDFGSFTDMKFWLVLSSDVDCDAQKMTGWNPSEYLFEGETISYTEEETTEEEVVESSNTFSEDKRCHATKPFDVAWSIYENNVLTWSAENGDKVEIRMGSDGVNYPFGFVTSNDGHETVGTGTTAGYWLGKWQMRTINGCKTGNWSTFSGHGSW